MNETTTASSQQSTTSEVDYEIPYVVHYTVCMTILMPLTVFGNCLIILIIVKEKKLQTIPNLFVSSLAVADTMVGSVVIPVTICMFWYPDAFQRNEASCMMAQFPFLVSMGSSLLNLMFISTDRFIAIAFPIKYINRATKWKAAKVIIGIWLFVLIAGLLPLFGWNRWNHQRYCDFFSVMDMGYVLLTAFVLIITTFVTTYLYIHIFVLAYRYGKKRRQQIRAAASSHNENTLGGNEQNSRSTYRKESKNVKVMALIYFLFLCFWMPFLIGGPLQQLISKSIRISEVKNFAFIVALSNSAANPLVYALMKAEFRSAILRLFHLRK